MIGRERHRSARIGELRLSQWSECTLFFNNCVFDLTSICLNSDSLSCEIVWLVMRCFLSKGKSLRNQVI